jgi:hypothetical protein
MAKAIGLILDRMRAFLAGFAKWRVHLVLWHPESLIRETRLEAFLMDFGFLPGEGFGCFIVGVDEGFDVRLSSATEAKEAPASAFPARVENQIST